MPAKVENLIYSNEVLLYDFQVRKNENLKIKNNTIKSKKKKILFCFIMNKRVSAHLFREHTRHHTD